MYVRTRSLCATPAAQCAARQHPYHVAATQRGSPLAAVAHVLVVPILQGREGGGWMGGPGRLVGKGKQQQHADTRALQYLTIKIPTFPHLCAALAWLVCFTLRHKELVIQRQERRKGVHAHQVLGRAEAGQALFDVLRLIWQVQGQ